MIEQEEICGICRDNLVTDIKTLDCNHMFHTECIDSWTVRVAHCPFCRAPVAGCVGGSVLSRARHGLFEEELDIIEAIAVDGISNADLELLIVERYISSTSIIFLIEEVDVPSEFILEALRVNLISQYNVFFLARGRYISGETLINIVLSGSIQVVLVDKLVRLNLFSLDAVVQFAKRGLISIHAFQACLHRCSMRLSLLYGRPYSAEMVLSLRPCELKRYMQMMPKDPYVTEVVFAIDILIELSNL